MKYAVTGISIVNGIVNNNGRAEGLPGGGGFYAFTGLRMVEKDSEYFTGAGPDYMDWYGDWYRNNGVGTAGIRYKLDKTIAETIVYDNTGEYRAAGTIVDTSAQIDAASLTADEIRDDIDGLKGMYLANPFLRQSPGMAQLRLEHGFKVMWEYTRDRECQEGIHDYLDACDIWSLNLPEAEELFGTDREEACIEGIKRLERPCFFRVGTRGSYMISEGETVFAPPVLLGGKLGIDATGCGNTSTAAAMWAFCEGYGLREIAVLANTVAAFNAAQFGPVPLINGDLRDKVRKTYESVL